METITTSVKVCGKKRCRKVRAKVDTGAFGTIIPRSMADAAGLEPTGRYGSALGVGNKRVRLHEAEATICLPGKCRCRKQKVYIADDNALHGEMLIGMDYLSAMSAAVSAKTGKVSCGRAGRKGPKSR